MKFGLPAKLAIFLLMASPFSYAEFECLPLAGSTQFMSTSGTGCPQRSFKMVGSTQCEVVLHEPQCTGIEGQWFGTYRFTGSVYDAQPDPEDPQDPSGIQYPESTFVPFEPSSNAVTASNNAGSAISDFSQKMAVSLNTLATNQSVLRSEAQDNKHQILSVMGQYNDQSYNRDVHLRGTLLSLNQQVVSSFDAVEQSLDEKFTENKELHEKTHESQTAAQESLDLFGENLNQAAIGIENARYHAQVAANRAENAEISARESISASQNAEQASYETYELAYETREDVREIYNRTYENIETLSSIQSATSELFGLRDQIRSDTRASAQDAAVSTQDTVWQSNDQIMSYMGSLNQSQATSLADIKDAIESSGGGSGEPTDLTQTNEKLDAIKASVDGTTTAAEATTDAVSGLGEKLDSINDALSSGSGNSSDTVAHGKLDGLGQKLDGIKGTLDGLSDTSGFADDLAQGTAQGKSDLNELLDGYNADTMLTDRFKQITDEAQKTMTDSGLGKFSDPSKFIDDSGMVKPDSFDDLISFAQNSGCAPYQMTIHGNSYQMDLCPYASDASAILTYVMAVLTAIFCFVMISQTLINERLS